MKEIKKKLMIIIHSILIINSTVCATDSQMKNSINIHHTTLWQLVEALVAQPSLAPDDIRQVLPVNFIERQHTANFSFYEGDSLSLEHQIKIKMIDLRVRHTDETSGMVGLLGISRTPCVTVDEVKSFYPDIVPVPPRGHMLVDAYFYNIQQSWGVLIFGFATRNQPCLASVVIDRTTRHSPPSPSPTTELLIDQEQPRHYLQTAPPQHQPS